MASRMVSQHPPLPPTEEQLTPPPGFCETFKHRARELSRDKQKLMAPSPYQLISALREALVLKSPWQELPK